MHESLRGMVASPGSICWPLLYEELKRAGYPGATEALMLAKPAHPEEEGVTRRLKAAALRRVGAWLAAQPT